MTVMEIGEKSYEDHWDMDEYERCDFETVEQKELIDQARWYNWFGRVARHKETGRLFQIMWAEDASESQEGQDRPDWEYYEVEAYEETVTKYRKLTSAEESVA